MSETIHPLRRRYPDKIPVIMKQAIDERNIPIPKHIKYLVGTDMTLGQLTHLFRKQLELKPEVALFYFIDNQLLSVQHLMKDLDKKYCKDGGILYIVYRSELCFGSSASS